MTTTHTRRFNLAPHLAAHIELGMRASLGADPNMESFTTQLSTLDGIVVVLTVEATIHGIIPLDRHHEIVGRHFKNASAT